MSEVFLDLSKENIEDLKIATKYCVEEVVHDAHVRASCAIGYPTIPAANPKDAPFKEPIAVVCSGPSLKYSWEEIKGYKNIMTCSGAHDFLSERGIIPTWHMETDPREHKSVFVKNPHKDVQYLIASNCHPQVFKNLEGHDIRLWHVLGSEKVRNVISTYPRGHWVLTGGSNVGLRALVMARVLGYVDIHVWGMDCSAEEITTPTEPELSMVLSETRFHTGFHPNEPKTKNHRTVKVGDRYFLTSETFLEYARQFFKETLMLSDAIITLHGDGLLQALAVQRFTDPEFIAKRKEEITKQKTFTIAMVVPDVISEEYKQLNIQLHKDRVDYGIGGAKYADTVKELREKTKAESVLDYGCGKGMLAKNLPFPIWEYDPAIPDKDDPPRPADLVICTDVLEHIEPTYLDAALLDLARVTLKIGYFVISTRKSTKILSDGRNAHLIIENKDWWTSKLKVYFYVASIIEQNSELHVVVAPRKMAKNKDA